MKWNTTIILFSQCPKCKCFWIEGQSKRVITKSPFSVYGRDPRLGIPKVRSPMMRLWSSPNLHLGNVLQPFELYPSYSIIMNLNICPSWGVRGWVILCLLWTSTIPPTLKRSRDIHGYNVPLKGKKIKCFVLYFGCLANKYLLMKVVCWPCLTWQGYCV